MSIILVFTLQEELLSSKMKKLRKQKKYRGDSTLPPEFDVNIPKPRYYGYFYLLDLNA